MITERTIAEKFTVIWKEHFPLLTPGFMKAFNETHVKTINRTSVPAIEGGRNDILSEVAFNIFQMVVENNLASSSFLERSITAPIALDTAKVLWKAPELTEEELALTQDEIKEIVSLVNNSLEFAFKIGVNDCEFKPQLKGYGILSDLTADLSLGDTLYEFKTIKENFRSSHIKQVFLYLALQQVTGNVRWQYFGLYNPRKGTFCKLNIRNTIYELSGGKTPNEVFKDLLDSLTRDVIIDSQF